MGDNPVISYLFNFITILLRFNSMLYPAIMNLSRFSASLIRRQREGCGCSI